MGQSQADALNDDDERRVSTHTEGSPARSSQEDDIKRNDIPLGSRINNHRHDIPAFGSATGLETSKTMDARLDGSTLHEEHSSFFELFEKASTDIAHQRVRNRLFLTEYLINEETNADSSRFEIQENRNDCSFHGAADGEDDTGVCITFDLEHSRIVDESRDEGTYSLSEFTGDDFASCFQSLSVSSSHFLEQEEAAVREAEEIASRMALELQQWSLIEELQECEEDE